MIEIKGCCEVCGKEATRSNIREFYEVPTYINGGISRFDLCSDCLKRLSALPVNLVDKILVLREQYGN